MHNFLDSAKRMSIQIHALLEFSELGKAAMEKKAVCMNDMVWDVLMN